jgi:DNA invertase Pin-like site-specific DNA recombinase
MHSSPFRAIYLRKSRDKAEVADPELLSKHRRELLRLAQTHGDEVPTDRIFEEVGSGEKIDRRPVFLALLEEMERLPRNSTGRLYTTEVSRLTRGDLAARGRIQGALQRAQITHITRGRSYDLTSADDRFVWEIEAGISGYELGRYKQRQAAARVDMALEGQLRTGKPPMGWTWDRNLKRPVPNALFPVVQAICRDALTCSTYELSERYGISAATILNLLRNPFIAGWPAKRWFPHNGEREWIGPSHLLKAEKWIWPKAQADYPAACTLDEWHEIQAALDKRRELREKRNSDAGWCRDVIRFVGYEEAQPRLGTWKCPRVEAVLTYELAPKGVPRLYIARDKVHAAATVEILAILKNSSKLAKAIEAFQEAPKPPFAYSDTNAQIATLEGELDALTREQGRMLRENNTERLASISRTMQAIEKELKPLRAAAKAAARPIALDTGSLKLLRAITGGKAENLWAIATDTEKRSMANALLSCILVRVEPGPKGFGAGYRREVVGIASHPWVPQAQPTIMVERQG